MLIASLLFLIFVTSAKVNLLQKLKSLDTKNRTEFALNNTLNYNDPITLRKTQESEYNFEKPSASSSSIATTTEAKDHTTLYGPWRHQQMKKQQQQNTNNHRFNHYSTIKFNNDNLYSNKLKIFTQDVAKEAIQTAITKTTTTTTITTTTTTATTTTFNDNIYINDDENIDNDEKEHDDVDNIKDNADNLHEQHQRNLYAFLGPLPQLQQQLYQQQPEQQQKPTLPQEHHHLSDYRLFFNPERHTKFYLHTLSSPLYDGRAREEAVQEDDVVGQNNSDTADDDDVVVDVDVITTIMTNLTKSRILNIVTDTIGAAFGVVTRPVAAIHGIRIEEIQLYNGLSLRQSRFNPFNPCRILIHGWLGGFNAGIYTTLVPEYLKLGTQESYNIFTVDWGKGAITDYITASYRVKSVGRVVAKFIDFLHQESGIPFDNIQVIGFSMGAHIAGIAGKYVETGRLPVIYGLDPALPLFRHENPNERLDRNDADYVEIVHTSVGTYGYDHPLGHVDFYINFGYNQPGCFFNECSHIRAFQIFAQSLHNEVLLGRECSMELWLDLIKYKRCLSETGLELSMNAEGLNGSQMALRRGFYYMRTNSQPPYAVT